MPVLREYQLVAHPGSRTECARGGAIRARLRVRCSLLGLRGGGLVPAGAGERWAAVTQPRCLLQVTIPGQVRSPKNHRVMQRMGRVLRLMPSAGYLAWEQVAYRVLAEAVAGRREFPYDGPVWVRAVAYVTGHAPDLVAAMEAVGDVLQGEWLVQGGRKLAPLWAVICDDRQIVSWDGSRMVRVGRGESPRTEVTVFAWEGREVS